MNKNKILFFLIGNIIIAVCFIAIVFVNIFFLEGFAYYTMSAFATVTSGLALYLLFSWSSRNRPVIVVSDNSGTRSSELTKCREDIHKYLKENESSQYFREKLSSISGRLDAFDKRCEKLRGIITNRFCPAGLSYGRFAAPVEELREYVIKIVNNLLSRMQVFDEKEYMTRIDEFMRSGRRSEAEGYYAVMQQYKDFAEKTLVALDDAILRLDRLTLELSKLSEADIEKAQNIMNDLEEAIQNTQLYK